MSSPAPAEAPAADNVPNLQLDTVTGEMVSKRCGVLTECSCWTGGADRAHFSCSELKKRQKARQNAEKKAAKVGRELVGFHLESELIARSSGR